MLTPSYEQFRDLMRQKAFGEAVQLAEHEALGASSGNGFWLTQQALALTGLGEHARAIACADQALIEAPMNAYALLARGEARFASGQPTPAIADFEEVLNQRNPRVAFRAQNGLLNCLLGLGRWAEVLERVRDWAMPPTASVRWRVKALAGLGRLEEALAACHEWLAAAPDHPSALWSMTDLEIERDGLDPVIQRLGRLAKIPSRPPIYREIYASLCRRAGRDDLAATQYEKITSLGGHPRVARKQAFALAKSGKEAEAIPLMEELLRTNPRDVYVHSAYEAACARAQELERAWQFYNDLLAKHPEHKGLYGRLKRITKRMSAE